MVLEYCILYDKTSKDLEDQVNLKIKQGWQPLGPASVNIAQSSPGKIQTLWYQTMVK